MITDSDAGADIAGATERLSERATLSGGAASSSPRMARAVARAIGAEPADVAAGAVLDRREYADESGERARVADAGMRALGALRFNELVALVIPPSANLAHYTRLLEKSGTDRLLLVRQRPSGGSNPGPSGGSNDERPLSHKGFGMPGQGG
jgi:hypothetical protein